jgi:hypothetical protein
LAQSCRSRLFFPLLLLGVLSGCADSRAPDREAVASGAPSPPQSAPASVPSGPSGPTGSPLASGAPAAAGARWIPRPGTPWQWQLTEPVDQRVKVPVYDIDAFQNSAAVVAQLHRSGRKVICYVNVGAYESFRPDRGSFPARVIGRSNGWPGERWLDIRRIDILGPIMARRFDMCRAKGFDAVEPDLVEGYAERTGFPLTASDQLRYNRYIAGLAHARGMSVGLKNDLGQVRSLVGSFDFAVNEECAEFDECRELLPFIRAGKAVFHVEYSLPNGRFCAHTKALGFSSMRKRRSLDAARWPC